MGKRTVGNKFRNMFKFFMGPFHPMDENSADKLERQKTDVNTKFYIDEKGSNLIQQNI
jgi:hypothetical protein